MKIEVTGQQVRRALPWTIAAASTLVAVGALRLSMEIAGALVPWPKETKR